MPRYRPWVAQLIAFAAAAVVVEGFHRFCQEAFIIAAVVDHGGPVVGLVGKVGALDEIPAPHLDLVKAEVTRDCVDRPLGDVSAFGPAIAAIGVDRHGIGHDHPGARRVVLDLVGPGAEIDRVHRRAAACHVRQIGADIAQRLDLQAENPPVIAEGDFNRLGVRPAMVGRLMAFGTRFPPLDGYAKRARQIRAEQVLRIEMHLRAEPAADVGRDDPQAMLGNADRVRNPAAMHVRDLALQVKRQGAIDIALSQDRARLHAGRDQAIVGEAERDDLIGLPRGLAVVAAADLVDCGDVVGHVVVQLRRAIADRGFLVDDGGKYFVIDLDQPDGIVRPGLGFGDHQRDAFADETDPVDRDHGPVRHLRSRDDPVRNDRSDLACEIGTRQRQADAGRRARRGEIDLLDDGMGMRRSQHRHMQHARRLDVVGIAPLAGDELEILAPAQRLADIFERGCFSHDDAPPG